MSKSQSKAPARRKPRKLLKGRNAPASPRGVATAHKQAEAMRMRIAGKDFLEIAERVGYANRGGAYKAVMAGMRHMLAEPAEQLRNLHRERLSALLRLLWSELGEDTEGLPCVSCPECKKPLDIKIIKSIIQEWLDCKHAAIDRILKVLRREAELEGLDAPKGVELTGDLKIVLWSEKNGDGDSTDN